MKLRQPPGTVVYTGKHTEQTKITHIQYSETDVLRHDHIVPLSTDHVDWIYFEGLENVDVIRQLCKEYHVDDLVIEDIFNLDQRNKVEMYEDYLFFVIKYYYLENDEILSDYLSLLLFDELLICFSEGKNRFKDDIVKRLQNKALLTRLDEDYLFYVFYDMIVDEGMNVVLYLQRELEKLEADILHADSKNQTQMYSILRKLVLLRGNMSQLQQNVLPTKLFESKLIQEKLKKYFVDLEDHITNVYDKTKISIEQTHMVISLYSNTLSNRMNEIMKTLTIFSAIFIPLSFFAGVFGMNFTNFAVLNNEYGLIGFGVLCVAIVAWMLFYFKKRKWF